MCENCGGRKREESHQNVLLVSDGGSVGIESNNLFLERFKETSFVNSPIVEGIFPLNRLSERDLACRR